MTTEKAENLLLTAADVREALGATVQVTPGATPDSGGLGAVLQAAARSYAFRRFDGHSVGDDAERPLAVSSMALVFAPASVAETTFRNLAAAAHLSTEVDGVSVAVETVTAPNGLVSYWGFVQRDDAIVVVTLDTLDPQRISVADLRSLVGNVARRFEQMGRT